MNTKLLILSIIIAASFIACTRSAQLLPQEITLKNFADQYLSLNDSSSVLVCDFRQYNKIVKKKAWGFVLKKRKADRFYYIDISLPSNRELQYIFSFVRLPSVLRLDSEGNINCIEDAEGVHLLERSRSSCYISMIRAFFSLESDEPDPLLIQSLSDNADMEDNFYVNTLLARAYDKLHREELANEYWRKATSVFESNPDFILKRLYIEAMKRLNDTLTHVVISPTDISLGEVSMESECNVIISVSNYGRRPFLLTDVIPSCSCVHISHPRIVKAGSTDTMVVKYKSNGEIGPFEQSIRINPAIYGNKYRIHIKGTQK
ncbi:MAG: DUF1573 domain-containing protein [Bacteroidales bacterium]|nr:DUF1573 domain-containing protein [Bacteroidales bacterium]